MLSRANPILQFGNKFFALTDGADTNGMNLWSVIDRCRKYWRPTIRTERLLPFGAALGCFQVYFQFTRSKLKRALPRRHDAAKCRARQSLAVGTVADPRHFRIGLCLVGNKATVTGSVDFHCGVSVHGVLSVGRSSF